MNTSQIASRLVELCRRHEDAVAQRELFSDDAVSIEPEGTPGGVARGRAALAEKAKMFADRFEVHGETVSDPVVSTDFFACTMTADVTDRQSKQRLTLSEVCVYEVKNGKIVREQFFYRPGP